MLPKIIRFNYLTSIMFSFNSIYINVKFTLSYYNDFKCLNSIVYSKFDGFICFFLNMRL